MTAASVAWPVCSALQPSGTGLDPYFETGLIDFGSASSKGITTSVPRFHCRTFDVTVNVAPSQSFVLIAKLSALTGH